MSTYDSRDIPTSEPSALLAAQGYFELGMHDECRKCLDELSRNLRNRPDVLELEILMLIQEERWVAAQALCLHGMNRYPDYAFGYVNLAFIFHETGDTAGALKLLEDMHHIVGVEPVASYNRGCYLVRLGRVAEGVFWLSKSFRGDPTLRTWAMRDPDLSGIRSHIVEDDDEMAFLSGD